MRTTLSATVLATTLLLGASTVMAQAADQVFECGRSLQWVGYQPVFNWKYDDTAIFNLTVTYDVAACTQPAVVSGAAVVLNDFVDGRVFRCTLSNQIRADRNSFLATCTRQTHGAMARAARDSDQEVKSDWAVTAQVGVEPDAFGSTYNFRVITEDEPAAPAPSGTLNRRRGTSEQQHRFDCPIGQTSCWTGERNDYVCMDTSSDVTACGRCPYALEADDAQSDCTSIEGADDVQCKNSKCLVNACQRGFNLSLDKTKCIESRKRSITARPLHA